jgi:integrase
VAWNFRRLRVKRTLFREALAGVETPAAERPKRKTRHHPALPYAETPQFMAGLARAEGAAAQALQFLFFTVCRTNEVLGARWTEIDWPAAVWKIPDERMKMDEDHVPLTEPALAILDRMRDGRQSDLIFLSAGDELFSDAPRSRSLGIWACRRARLPGGVRDLGGGMYGLSRRREGSRAGAQI